MERIPTFTKLGTRYVHTGWQPMTPDQQNARNQAQRDAMDIDIRRHFRDLQVRSDQRGFKEQQRMLGDKAWRDGKPLKAELKPFRPSFHAKRPRVQQPQTQTQVAA